MFYRLQVLVGTVLLIFVSVSTKMFVQVKTDVLRTTRDVRRSDTLRSKFYNEIYRYCSTGICYNTSLLDYLLSRQFLISYPNQPTGCVKGISGLVPSLYVHVQLTVHTDSNYC